MDVSGQMTGSFKLSFDKGSIDDEPRRIVRDLQTAPLFDVLAHRLEIPLHAVYPDGQGVQNGEVLGVLGQDRREFSLKGQIVANQDSILCAGNRYEEEMYGISIRRGCRFTTASDNFHCLTAMLI